MMKSPRLLLIWLAAMLLPSTIGGAQDAGTVARRFEEGGRFTKAAILLQAAIADTNTPAAERRKPSSSWSG